MRLPWPRRPRPGPAKKAVFQEPIDCLTFERWREFDALTMRLFRQGQMIELLRQSDLGREAKRAPSGGPECVIPVEGDSG